MKSHCLPFSQIPHTTPLFTDFLAFVPKVQSFYPRPPHLSEWLKEEAARISYDPSRRERVTSILERQNKSWDASPKTLANLERLRQGRGRRRHGAAGWPFRRTHVRHLQSADCSQTRRRGALPRESMLSPFSGWPPMTMIWPR